MGKFQKVIILTAIVSIICSLSPFNIVNVFALDNTKEKVLPGNLGQTEVGAGNYLIEFKDSNAKARGKTKIIKNKGKIKKDYKRSNLMQACLNIDLAKSLKNDKDIALIEEDSTVKVQETTPWGIEKVNAPLLHNKGIKGNGVKIAVFDTGINENPDLAISGGVSFIESLPSYGDDNGHGTHVAGIISSLINSKGIIGVAPSASIYSVKVISSNGVGSYSSIIQGIEWAIDNKINIINMSFSGNTYSKALEKAINLAYSNNILVIASAGNYGVNTNDTITYPAKYENVIAVGAVDSHNQKAAFSSIGDKIELVAPGVDITSTSIKGGYEVKSGTSMASPHVVGVAALLWGKDLKVSNKAIRGLLAYSARDLGDPKWFGNGLVDAQLALEDYDEYISSQPKSSNEKYKTGKTKHLLDKTKSEGYVNLESEIPASSDDYGNDIGSAYMIEYGEELSGNIDYPWDEDYFKFATTNKGIYEIKSTGNFDVAGELYDKAGNMIASNDDSGGSVNFNITQTLNPFETYYIKVRHHHPLGVVGYGVNLNVISVFTPENSDETVTDMKLAPVISAGSVRKAAINYPGDYDYFKFSTTGSGYYFLDSTGSTDVSAELYNSSLQLITSNDDFLDKNFHIGANLESNQTYYIKVKYFNDLGVGNYSVKVTHPTSPFDFGNSKENATQIEFGSQIPGDINWVGDSDWFTFKANVAGSYTIQSTGETDVYGELYDSNGNMLAYGDDDVGRNFKIVKSLTANQVYYIKVCHFSIYQTGPYGLMVTNPTNSNDVYGDSLNKTQIQVGKTVGGTIGLAGDTDWFSFTAPFAGECIIQTSGSTDTYGELYDSSNTLIGSNDNTSLTNSNFYISKTLTANATYYLKVRHNSTSGTGGYAFSVSMPLKQYLSGTSYYDVTASNAFTYVMLGQSFKDMNKYCFEVIYNSNELDVQDLCSLTYTPEVTVGEIPDSDINITHFEPGKIRFTCRKEINENYLLSGTINNIKFIPKSNIKTQVKYNIYNIMN